MSASPWLAQVQLQRAPLQAEAFVAKAQRIADTHVQKAERAALAANQHWDAVLKQGPPPYLVEEAMLPLLQ
jgi:hypothetical protein